MYVCVCVCVSKRERDCEFLSYCKVYATLASEQPTSVRRLYVSSSSTFTKRLFRSFSSNKPFRAGAPTLSLSLSFSLSLFPPLFPFPSLPLSHSLSLPLSLFVHLSLTLRARVCMSIVFHLSASQLVLSYRSTKVSFAVYSSGQQQMSVHAERRKNNNNNNNNNTDVARKTFHAEINFIW